MKDNWYVLFALVAKENKLCSVLRRKGLDAFILKECFIPRCKRLKSLEGNGRMLKKFFLKGMCL